MATLQISQLDPELMKVIRDDIVKAFEQDLIAVTGWKPNWLHRKLETLRLVNATQEEMEAVADIYNMCMNLAGHVNWDIADQMYADWWKETYGRQTSGDLPHTDK